MQATKIYNLDNDLTDKYIMKILSYCTYITFYYGNQLPPFYIGSTTVEKIKNDYKGTVSSKKYKQIWKEEIKNNPKLFKTKIITFHESRKEAYDREEYFQNKLNVVKNSLYTNMSTAMSRPTFKGYKHSAETIEKKRIISTGKKHSEETKRKISKIHKGKKLTPEQLEKLSQSRPKFHSEETKQKMRNYWKSIEGAATKQRIIDSNKNKPPEKYWYKPTQEHIKKVSYGNHPNAKPIEINGNKYASMREAREYLFPGYSKDRGMRALKKLLMP